MPPQKILDLMKRFQDNLEAYRAGQYNETQVRREFIDPFLKALGWDVDNEQGYAEAYKDVVHEDAIRVGGAVKAPDYSCRIGGQRKFFVEAKKPAVNIKEDIHPAYQLCRYAWSAKLPLSILTDFEEFAVYDCRVKPEKTDKASAARLMYFQFTDYAEKWEEIVGIFSPEAIRKGSFDKFAHEKKGQRGTAEVDTAFLQEISTWRDELAANIALRNKERKLKSRDLSFAVQSTIDRLIFLRIAEDRGIEPYGRLRDLAAGKDVYARLADVFRLADAKYNSGLFHFQHEKGRDDSSLDSLTLSLVIDDKVLKGIIGRLYYPDSPYQFDVIPADILGQVYEQFLGKVIRLTVKGQAKVEEKPEVKKAGGVYYTPTYIVQYIVQQTVGKLVAQETELFQKTQFLTILDPACGSGSFLLGAYQFLLDWYVGQYNQQPEKWLKGKNPRIFDDGKGNLRLTIGERKRILLAHIYGVDIDPQAVEVTKLSLLLKVLEGETAQTLGAQMALLPERVLPDLSRNIQCGNSLIGPDFYEGQQLGLAGIADEEEFYRINAFDWQAAFPQVMERGGFDVVIGNPPYGAYFSKDEQDYIKQQYQSYKYKFDSYIYFIEKAIQLTCYKGRISFITPELWLKLENCTPLRKLVTESVGFELLKTFGENVFENAVVNTIVFVFQKGVAKENLIVINQGASWEIPSLNWQSNQLYSIEYRVKPQTRDLIRKIEQISLPLSTYGEIIQGLTPYDRYQGQDPELIKRRGYHFTYKKDDTCGKWLSGKDVSRYFQTWSGEWLSYGSWLAAPREERFFVGVRLLFREIPGKNKRIQATYTEDTYYYGHSITPFKLKEAASLSIKYLLGISNSKLLSWYGGLMLPNFGKDIFPKLNPNDIKMLPIRPIDFSNKDNVNQYGQIIGLVSDMLDLNQRLQEAHTAHEKTVLQRQIAATDHQIDQLVYQLYNLTPEEIALIEES